MIDDQKLATIRQWLGTGSINIFGLPFSGKDTVARALAEIFDAEILSSGDLLRAYGETQQESGLLSPKNIFFDVVLPAFHNPELKNKPLILSSIGRWHGEETRVIETAEQSGHPIKLAVMLEISDTEMKKRLEYSSKFDDRGIRFDDHAEILKTRLTEFQTKTLPVTETYRDLGLLLTIDGTGPREQVVANILSQLPPSTNPN